MLYMCVRVPEQSASNKWCAECAYGAFISCQQCCLCDFNDKACVSCVLLLLRALALRCVVRVMSSLSRLPPADARVYNDYLLPSLSLLPNDPEESVRVAYAQVCVGVWAVCCTSLWL